MANERARIVVVALAVGVAVLAGLAGFMPIRSTSREQVFIIPQGTWAQRMSGHKVPLLPDEIRLTLGVRDVLLLKNEDDVPQIFGPALMMPHQSFTLPFETASDYQFACTAHASGQMTVVVEPYPAMPWARAWWRMRNLARLQGTS
jgi:hypothetical protein